MHLDMFRYKRKLVQHKYFANTNHKCPVIVWFSTDLLVLPVWRKIMQKSMQHVRHSTATIKLKINSKVVRQPNLRPHLERTGLSFFTRTLSLGKGVFSVITSAKGFSCILITVLLGSTSGFFPGFPFASISYSGQLSVWPLGVLLRAIQVYGVVVFFSNIMMDLVTCKS